MTDTRSEVAEGRRVFILDATTGVDAFVYQEAGSWCGAVAGPSVTIAQRYLSLPWTLVGRHGGSVTVRYRAPGCSGSTVTARASGTPHRQEAMVIAGRPTQAEGCPATAQATMHVELAPLGAELTHAPTGPVTGLYASLQPTRFDYYDGNR